MSLLVNTLSTGLGATSGGCVLVFFLVDMVFSFVSLVNTWLTMLATLAWPTGSMFCIAGGLVSSCADVIAMAVSMSMLSSNITLSVFAYSLRYPFLCTCT